jgi:hypothetical protein
MFRYNKKSQLLVLLILIIVCAINTNFFRNLADVTLFKYDNRIVKTYGFCSDESIGYLFYLKKKYKINDNPKIINYIHTPNVNWAIINTKIINENSKKIILLNYPGPEFKINLIKISNNLFQLKDFYFLSDKFDQINSLEILNNSKDLKKINWKLDVLTIDESEDEKIIGQFNIENFLDEKLIFALDILNENLNLNKKKLYFKIKSKDFVKIEDLKIHLNVKNKYILEKFQIIDQINNCYYVK